ncbi:MAG: hypothetical protein BroJett001_32740 [Chloroflexota bacterium]|nr:MAG: hypothetical protein BroJett001_32740 [Chloroflexota bacterium]GJQ37576.1 MAG: hypothetical protein JETCAE01_35860 [Anaerolineaceae bacterium]
MDVRISVGDGGEVNGCCDIDAQEDKEVARIMIIVIGNFIFPTFSAQRSPPNGLR